MNGRWTGGSRLWPSGSNEIRWCNAVCPSLPACLERNPPACRPWPDAQPDAVWADSASGTWYSPMAIFPASHQRIRWLSAGGWERKNWRVFGGPPMYAIWEGPSHYFHLHARAPPTAVPGCVDERISSSSSSCFIPKFAEQITQTPVSGSCCLPLGALQSMWATLCKI